MPVPDRPTESDEARRRAYHVGNMRARLLDEARAMVEEGGLGQLSLRTLASRAGIVPASVYHHFDSKGALLAQLACEGFGELKRDLIKAVADSADGRYVRACAAAYVGFAQRQPALYALMFDPPTLATRQVSLARDEAFGVLENAILNAPTQQGREPEVLRKVAVAVWTCAHGAASMAAAQADGEQFFDDVIQGLEALFRRR